ncbi:MAG: radical SAM protein [Candidatus Paceibacterota bacterium]|jgi:radical SAM protein with 4Fe4S-binding SPASM domain
MNTKAPIIQQHELLPNCNNNCGFCYNPERCWKQTFTPRKEDENLNLKITELSISKGIMASCLTGGEPTLVPKHLLNLLQIYKNVGCYKSINSNGRLIDKSLAKKLKDVDLNSALISIHGVGQLHNYMVGDNNAFIETKNGIANLMEAGIHVVPNFVATAKNIHGLEDVGIMLLKMGLNFMTVTPFLPSWATPEHEQYIMQTENYRKYFEVISKIGKLGMKIDSTLPIPPCVLIKFFPDNWVDYLEVLSPRVCMAGKSFGVISPDGMFRSCIQAPYFETYGGNVVDEYEKSWKRSNKWADLKLLPKECLECKALSVCGGGCRTSCLWENNGSPFGKTMYMDKPLSETEAQYFIKRTEVKIESKNGPYAWQPQIKMRDEGWGIIIFNSNNQSFCLLASEFRKYLKTESLDIQDKHTTEVLLSFGAINKTDKISNITVIPNEIKSLPANIIFPRLADGLTNDIVRELRSDTGERLRF